MLLVDKCHPPHPLEYHDRSDDQRNRRVALKKVGDRIGIAIAIISVIVLVIVVAGSIWLYFNFTT